MTGLVWSLLASAVLLGALTAQAGADSSVPPLQVTLGEPLAAVHKALGQFDVLSQYGGPADSPMESFLASGLDIQFFRGTVETIGVRHTSPPMGLASAQKARQAYVSVRRVGAGDAVPISIGETAHAVHLALGGFDRMAIFGPLGSQAESYFAAGLSVQYSHNKVAELTVRRFAPLPKRRHTTNAKFKQAVVLVPGA